MIVRYQNEVADLIAFFEHAVNNSSSIRKAVAWRRFFLIPFGCLAIFGLFFTLSDRDPSGFGFPWTVVVACAIYAPIAWFGAKPSSKRLLKHLAAEAGLTSEREMEVDDHSLTVRTKNSSHSCEVNALHDVIVGSPYTFIFTTPQAGYVLRRKNVLEGDYEEFVRTLRRTWKKARAQIETGIRAENTAFRAEK